STAPRPSAGAIMRRPYSPTSSTPGSGSTRRKPSLRWQERSFGGRKRLIRSGCDALLPAPAHLRQHRFEQWGHPAQAPGLDDHVPERLELLPPGGVEEVFRAVADGVVGERSPRDVPPAVKVAIGAMIARLQRLGGEAGRAVDDMAGVVEVPVRAEDPALGGERLVEAGPGVGRLDVEGGGGDSVAYRPVDGAVEHVRPVLVHSEDEGAVDHDAEITEAPRHRRIVAGEVLLLVACPEVRRVEGFEADEERPQPRLRRALYKVAAKHGIDGGGALEEASHAAHPLEQGLGEAAVAEQMVVEKIE